MEESEDMLYEREGLSPEKSRKRFKTPAQVQALEKFYNEHKYPNESMKSQFAVQVGLTERQVAGWFCHRRAKDKKLLHDEVLTNRNQKISNGGAVIHESTSGLRQESCNSTKQADRYFDGKEVESNRWKSSHTITEDRFSGSSTTSYERLLKEGRDNNCDMKPEYLLWDENYMATESMGVKKRGYMKDIGSRYIESPDAVSLVKLRLGRDYREDGPPLATEFDSLPPGAFDSPVRSLTIEPYYVGDPIQPRSCGIQMTVEEPMMYGKYRDERMPSGLSPEGSGYHNKLQRFNHSSNFTGCRLTTKAFNVENNNRVSDRTFIMDEKEDDFAGEADNDYIYNNMRSTKNRFAGEFVDNKKVNAIKPLGYPLPRHNYNAPMSRRELFGAKISKPVVQKKTNEFLNTEGRMQSRGMLKVLNKKIQKETGFHENHDSVCPEMLMKSDTRMARKVHGKGFLRRM